MQSKFSFAPSLTPPQKFFQLPARGSGANQTEIKSKLSKPLDTPPHLSSPRLTPPHVNSHPQPGPIPKNQKKNKTHPGLSCLSITHHYVDKNGQPAADKRQNKSTQGMMSVGEVGGEKRAKKWAGGHQNLNFHAGKRKSERKRTRAKQPKLLNAGIKMPCTSDLSFCIFS